MWPRNAHTLGFRERESLGMGESAFGGEEEEEEEEHYIVLVRLCD